MMTGTPIIGVMALTGMVPPRLSEGATDIIWHSRPIRAPQRAVAGMRILWLELAMSMRAMCGTANPMKPIGPHQAVTTAVSDPERRRRVERTRPTDTPTFSAKRWPKRRALRLLAYGTVHSVSVTVSAENNARLPMPTAENVPMPHSTNEWTALSVEKKLSSEMAEEER